MPAEQMPEIAEGDVLVRNLVGGTGPVARVAGEAEAGALLGVGVHLFRPDPARLDPWFLLGFLSSEANLAGASTGSSALPLSPGRLRVPLLPPAEQQRYREAFRHGHALRAEARRATRLAEETARLLSGGLAHRRPITAARDVTSRPSHGNSPIGYHIAAVTTWECVCTADSVRQEPNTHGRNAENHPMSGGRARAAKHARSRRTSHGRRRTP
ncbi:hypothetical protein ACFP51_34910 [Streptomyces pratens]|uniref:Type I restriction modification DNA specificity domain-containing protein n=1 Tax=Streptomyces pratens TaxID=887456 RepID=A0ABW1M2G5_9ACTN